MFLSYLSNVQFYRKDLWSLVTQTELCSVQFLLSARNWQLSCPDNTQVLLFRSRKLYSSQELLSLPFIKWEGFSLSFSILKFAQDLSCKCQVLDNKSTYLLWSQKQLIFYIRLGISRKLWFLFDWAVSQLFNSVYICKWFGISNNLFWSWLCVHEKYHCRNSEIMYCGFQISFFWVMRGAWLDVPFRVAPLLVYLTPLASCPTSWSSGHLLMCSLDLANVKKKNPEQIVKANIVKRRLWPRVNASLGTWVSLWGNCSLGSGSQAAGITPPTSCHFHRCSLN